jgi:hypothetical protein
MRTKAFKNELGFFIVIDEDVFEMNTQANLPNGVNLYLGTIKELDKKAFGKRIALRDLPGGVLEGIELRKRITKQEGGATK